MLAEGLVHRWGARAKHAVLMRISSHMRPQRAAYFSDGPTRHHRSGPPPRPRSAVFALLKTRNRLYISKDHESTKKSRFSVVKQYIPASPVLRSSAVHAGVR